MDTPIDPSSIESMSGLLAIFAGLGLSAAAGFRVFVPLLALALAGKSGALELGSGFEWLASWPAILMLGTATLTEVAAYYIPWVDNLLDTIAGPSAVVAGTVITAAVMPEMNDAVQWGLAAIVGGGSAGIIQAGTTLTRATSTATTGGAGNALVSTGEAGGAVGLSIFAFIVPFIIGCLVLLLLIWLGTKLVKRFMRKRQEVTPMPRASAG